MYFGEVINSFQDLMHQRDKFTFSWRGLDELDGEWWDKHAEQLNGHKFVAASFSDYDGGDRELDNLVYRKVKEIADKDGTATYEEVWNGGRGYGNPYVMGGNAIIFGELADKMCEGKGDCYKWYSPLGDLDNDEMELRDEFIEKNIEYIAQDKDLAPLSDEDKRFLYDWLNDYGRVLSTDIDYSYDDMEKALEAFRGKVKDAPGQQHFYFDKGEVDNPDNQPRESVEEADNDDKVLASVSSASNFDLEDSWRVVDKKYNEVVAYFRLRRDAEDFVECIKSVPKEDLSIVNLKMHKAVM